jgi:hypothetical protein
MQTSLLFRRKSLGIPIRTITRVTLLIFVFATMAMGCASQKWSNPCASGKALSAQQTVFKSGTGSTDVCSFLDRTYEEVDNRCGITLVSRIWPPTKWFHSRHPYDTVPNDVLQDIPRDAFQNSDWIEFSVPSLSRLMTTLYFQDSGGAPPPTDWGKLSTNPPIQDPPELPNTLHFNPLLAPEIMFDQGSAESTHGITCTSALSASESGSLNVSLAVASEKFSAEANSSSQAEITYGKFVSPMAYLAETHIASFLFEALDLYQRYNGINGVQVSPSEKIYYLNGAEGIVVYETEKKQLTTDASASASMSYAVPIGGISASGNGDQNYQGNSSANLYYSLIRKTTWAQLPTLDQTLTRLNQIGPGLISYTNANASQAEYDAKSKSVVASFVMEWMPSSLCSSSIWKVLSPEPADIKLYSHFLSSTQQVKAAPGTLPNTESSAGATSPPSVCVWTISTKQATGEGIKGTLSFILDTTPTLNKIAFDFPYSLSVPKLQLMATADAANTSVEFWYQVQKPTLLDSTILPALIPPDTLVCGATTINSPITSTITVAASYSPAGGGPAVTGSFFDVRYQWKSPNPTNLTAACTPAGSVVVTLQGGAPATIILPTAL